MPIASFRDNARSLRHARVRCKASQVEGEIELPGRQECSVALKVGYDALVDVPAACATGRAAGPGPRPPTSLARWLTPRGVKMTDEVIGPFPQNDIGRLHVRDRVSLLRKGLLVRLGILRARKKCVR